MNCDASYASSSTSTTAASSHRNGSVTTTTTTTMPDRDFNYIPTDASERAVAKGGVACPFPWRLHEVLKVAREEGLEDVVSWASHGRAFTVHKPREFVEKLMTRFFCQTKFASFQRQLNLYGFARFCHGRDKGAYYHHCFVRGRRGLVRHMIRRKIKGGGGGGHQLRRPLPQEEPDFYARTKMTKKTTNTQTSKPSDDNGGGGDNNNNGSVHYMHGPSSTHPQLQQHAVSPVPSSVLYNYNNNGDDTMMEQITFQREVSWDVPHNDEEDLDLFEDGLFQLVDDDEEQQPQDDVVNDNTTTALGWCPPPTTTTTFAPLDPTTELARIRARIRQKRAEYERTTGNRAPNGPPPPSPSYRHAGGGGGGTIPVYKGSYISV